MQAFYFFSGLALVILALGIVGYLDNKSRPTYEDDENYEEHFVGDTESNADSSELEGTIWDEMSRAFDKTNKGLQINHSGAGWHCPNCGKANAPFVRQCDCPPQVDTVTSTGIEITM